MARIIDEKQQANLERLNIEIATKYLDQDTYIVKSTKEENNDSRNVNDGIVIEKLFLRDGLPLMKCKNYDVRVHYRFLTAEDEWQEISCPNCGNTSIGKDFVNGCPYCRTFFNMDYKDKTLGTKYYYDYVMKDNKYLGITLLIDVIVSFGITFSYVLLTGRTFNMYDIGKASLFGVLFSIVLFGVFYFLDAYIVTLPIKAIKTKENRKQQKFWQEMSTHGYDKNRFMNDFHFDLRNELYARKEVIDYDILDYSSYTFGEKDGRVQITMEYELRTACYIDEHIVMKQEKRSSILRRNDEKAYISKEGMNMIMCPNCASSIRITDGKCAYCDRTVNPYQNWIMQKN